MHGTTMDVFILENGIICLMTKKKVVLALNMFPKSITIWETSRMEKEMEKESLKLLILIKTVLSDTTVNGRMENLMGLVNTLTIKTTNMLEIFRMVKRLVKL